MENYSEELKNFIYNDTKLINDENITKINQGELGEDKSLISIIIKLLEKQISSKNNKCLILYLSELSKNASLKKELLEIINNKYRKEGLKIKEIAEINFILIYNISHEEFINNNYDKLTEYFEDYLSQLNEFKEYEQIKNKIMDNILIEEIEDQKRKQKLILPRINNCEIINITYNEIMLNVPLFDEDEILEKNKYNIKDCFNNYKDTKIEYVLYLFNQEKKCYDKFIFEKNKEKVNFKEKKFEIKISNLKPNKIYMFLLGIKFDQIFSNPTFNKYYFITLPHIKSGKLFVYGHKKYKNNLVEEESMISIPKNILNINTYESCFENNKTIYPLQYKANINDINTSDTRIIYIQNDKNFTVIEAGKIITIQPKDYFEGSFPQKEEIFNISDTSHFLEFFDSNIFKINFDPKIKIRKIRVGLNHCLALSTLGECYSWGENSFGQLGLGLKTDIIVGNPQKIHFDIFDNNSNKLITDNKPIFYDISAGNFFSLALGIFNNKQKLYFWGNGSGLLNDDSTNIIQSIYPKPINNIDNIIKIYSKFNSIGIFCQDKNKKINYLYIHGTQKFGMDYGINSYERVNPTKVNYFIDNNINVLNVNFSITCISVIGKNMNNGKIEVYLRGELTKKLFGYKNYKTDFYKFQNNWSENIVAISPQEKVIFFLLNNGTVKKLWFNENKLNEKEFKIEGYDLTNFDINDINTIKFESFHDENFIIYYKLKSNLTQ